MQKLQNEKLIVDGKRINGRAFDELRDVKIVAGVLDRANGSAYIELGNNKIYAAVYGPRQVFPKHLLSSERAVIRCRYNMAPFSVEDRKRPGPDRRSVEISKVTKECLGPAVFLERFPNSMIDVFIEVMQADAGTRCTGITAAAVALADAGIPMKGLVSACAAGKVDGEVVLDLDKSEDNLGEADLPIAYAHATDEITLLQMDGHLSSEEFQKGVEFAIGGCKTLYEHQKKALLDKYGGN